MSEQQTYVSVRHLKKYFKVKGKGTLHAVDDVSFDVFDGETLGLVGESGCGKSTVGNVIMRLLPPSGGEVWCEDKNVFTLSEKDSREYRKKMQMIFQDPYSSLNPQKTIKQILSEPYLLHDMHKGQKLDRKIEELLDTVGLEHNVLYKFPHELDGGRRQLVGIGRALSLNSRFIVCDEPVSALDVSMQATIINLLMELQKRLGLSLLFISHDLSVVRHISSRIAVMYLGQIVELAETDTLFANAVHPYTIALLSAVPQVDLDKKIDRIVLKGDVPSPINPPEGCRFAGRCWMACEACRKTNPSLVEVEPGHYVACPYCNESRARLEHLDRKAGKLNIDAAAANYQEV